MKLLSNIFIKVGHPKRVEYLYYTGGCIEWDSKEWDSLSLIGSTREILEIRIEWDK